MDSQRYARILTLFEAALEKQPEERGAFLQHACAEDSSLQREVEEMLDQERLDTGLLSEGVEGVAAELWPDDPTQIRIGETLGDYRILSLIGAGGMGQVYLAEDTRLGRKAALKFLPEEYSADAAWVKRFETEARALSALNHPNIVTIYGVGQTGDLHFIATEYVDGVSLRRQMTRMDTPAVLGVARQIASALAAAHEAGVVHRDIKPENILIRTDGLLKVLDFGLAIRHENEPGSETQTMPGVIRGTPKYMSPEQAIGARIDERSDIFSFGIVLYEMLTGRNPFDGASDLECIQAAVHRAIPPISEVRPDLPIALRMLVEKAVEKDADERYQTMRDLVVDLRRAARIAPASLPHVSAPRRRISWKHAAAALALALAGALGGWYVHRALANPTEAKSILVQRLTDTIGLEETPAISPDSKTVAFAAQFAGHRHIWLRLLAGGSPLMITKDDGDHDGPRWAPDSASLIYFTTGTNAGDPGTIWESPALGGAPRRVVEALGPGDISHDGKSLAYFRFKDGGVELVVTARYQSETRTIARLPLGTCSNVRWSPDDSRIAFIQEPSALSFTTNLMTVPSAGGVPRRILGGAFLKGFAWTPHGSRLIVSSSQGSSMAYPPTQNLWVLGLDGRAPRQLTFGESSYESPDVDPQGNIVVSRLVSQSDVWKLPVTGNPVENARRATQITHQTGQVQTLTISPDESEVAFLSDNGGHANVWAARTSDGEMRPITKETDSRFLVAVPLWSPRGNFINFLSNRNSSSGDVTLWLVKPDGSESRDLGIVGVWSCWSDDSSWLYYSSVTDGVYHIRKIRVDGGQPVEVQQKDAVACAVTRDGSTLYFLKILAQASGAWDYEIRAAHPENGPSRVLGRVAGSRVPVEALDLQPDLSPDGRWLAMPLLDGATTDVWAISTDKGEWRKLVDFGSKIVVIARRIGWSRDGRYIYASISDVDSDIVRLVGLNP